MFRTNKFQWALLLVLAAASTAQAEDLGAGKALYTKNCLVCHGLKGAGNGPSGRALKPPPTNFTTAAYDDAEWHKATKLGGRAVGKSLAMPSFGSKLSDAEVNDVLAYVKALQAPAAP